MCTLALKKHFPNDVAPYSERKHIRNVMLPFVFMAVAFLLFLVNIFLIIELL